MYMCVYITCCVCVHVCVAPGVLYRVCGNVREIDTLLLAMNIRTHTQRQNTYHTYTPNTHDVIISYSCVIALLVLYTCIYR